MTKWTDEQKYAIEVENNNVIVSAGAGSGKTAVLTERVITKLKNGISLKNLVILTFTNAAAQEMKIRIKNKIIEEINKGFNLNTELDYIDQAIICTFDSYALYLVKKYSDILNIDKNITIGDKIVFDIKLDEIIDEIFDEKYNNEEKDFLELIDSYTVKNDEKIKKVVKDFYNSLNNRYGKQEYLNNYIGEKYSEDYINSSIKDYLELINKSVLIIKEELYKLNVAEEQEYVEKLRDYLADLVVINGYDGFKEYVDNLSNLPRLPKNASELLVNAKDNIKKQLDNIKKLCKYKNVNEIKDSIMRTKKYIETIISLLKLIDIKMNEFKRQNNIYDFIDIACLGIDLLKNNSEVRESIKQEINEIMIDEYQDTNDIQDIFISYISNNNVYMVGDVKQSIYRFRNANPKLFMKKYNDYSNSSNGIKIDLIKNFRSRKEVLNDINVVFDDIMDEEIGGANYKESHRLVFGNEVYDKFSDENYSLEIYDYDSKNSKKEEIEAFVIARDIKYKMDNEYQVYDFKLDKLRKVEYNDFCILLDRSRQFDLYRKVFEYLGIPLSVHKNDSFIHSDEMYTILNLLKVIYSYKNKSYMYQYFRHSFMSIVRSFLFEFSDDSITKLMIDEDILKSISSEESEFYQIYLKTKNISNNIEYMTLDQILLSIYKEFNIREKISTLGNFNNIKIKLDYLLNKASELSNIGYCLYDFINYIDKVINDEDKDIEFKSNDNNNRSVSIMTIHASKGLEFNICYFPGLYKPFSKNDIQKQFLYSNKYGFIIPYIDEGLDNTIYLDLVKDDYKKDEISERLRLFYVALTRAKQKMIMLVNDYENEEKIITLDQRLEYNSFRAVLLSLKDSLKKYIKEVLDTSIDNNYKNLKLIEKLDYNKSKNIIHKNLQLESKLINEVSFSKKVHMLIDNETRKNIEYGKEIHRSLELADDNDKVVHIFNKKMFEIGIDMNKVSKYHEYEFIYDDEGTIRHGIIDLLIEDDNDMYIIDYKLKNIESKEYIKQLDGYKKYIEKKSKKRVSCYLYSILTSTLEKINF